MTLRTRALAVLSGFALGAATMPAILRAQDNVAAGDRPYAGSEMESYLRYMQILGAGADYSWSARPVSREMTLRLLSDSVADVWQAGALARSESGRGIRAFILSPHVSARGNSSFPHGSGDGAIWAGRGITAAASAGVSVSAGPLALEIAPLAFVSQNAEFYLKADYQCPPCRSALFPDAVDRPERFGTSAYARVTAGQSSLRLTYAGLSAALSNENLAWGPARNYPFLLGPNAAGFPHLSLGTASPRDLFIGKITGRVIFGRLAQSEYSPVTGDKYYFSFSESGRQRFASGLVFAIQPRGLTGLEVGVGRFFHTVWPRTGIPASYFTEPFEAFLKAGLAGGPVDEESGGLANQLASVFARWVFPGSGFELYGEYGREDHSFDFRDLMQEPDHARSYSMGATKVFGRTARGFSAVRGELINFQLPAIARLGRGEGSIYLHGLLRQGHTSEGQLLGADVAVGTGAASVLALDRYHAGGRTTWLLERKVEREDGWYFQTGIIEPKATDVSYTFRWDRLLRMRRFDLRTLAGITSELNRGFQRDAWNFNAALDIRHRGF